MYPTKNYPGLTRIQAEEKLQEFGLNVLPQQPPLSDVTLFLSQLKSPLVYILLIAALLTLVLNHFTDSLIIFLAVFLNTLLGYFQEKRANQAFLALQHFIAPKSEVIRESSRVKIATSQLVPGDLVVLSQGVKVPADGQLVFANRLYLSEAVITGESLPVGKSPNDQVYMGTTVSSGQAIMQITHTGSATKIGGIAVSVQQVNPDTPLKRQLADFSRKLAKLVLILVVCVFTIGLLRGNALLTLFTTSVALAVSSIPEGLLVSLTVVLAIGMQKILKRQGLVKQLSSAETLGGVTTICIDKTGTLTHGQMRVVDFVGDQMDLAKQALLANDLDDPIVISAFEWGRTIIKDFIDLHPRLDSIPFSPKDRFFTSLHRWTAQKNIVFVNGAPDILLDWTNATKEEKQRITDKIIELTSQGKRLIGFARKEVPHHKTHLSPSDATSQLQWIGMLAFFDPVRHSVKEALALANQAGINVKVITGDYSQTSRYVMAEIGMSLNSKQIMIGSQIDRLTPEELARKVPGIRLFARVSPDQKLQIVRALQANHEIVAMTGDGVNDAPAIHQADIGIVVSDASDVARESADLVLLDSNFGTIIAAIEEGRAIFDNIRKIILYLLSDAFAEILVIIGSIILNLPLPITAIQIIWINLISDGFPGLALTIDPSRTTLMHEPPRSPQEKLVTGWMTSLIATVSVAAAIIALIAFVVTYRLSGNLALASSMTFAILGLNSLAYVFSVRSLLTPFWHNHLFDNKVLILAVVAGIGLQVLPFATSTTRSFFGVISLTPTHWLIAGALSVFVFFVVEIFKSLYIPYRKDRKSSI